MLFFVKFATMFTGIIEALGVVRSINTSGSNLTLSIESTISNELKIDQSVSHNGVCLTVESVSGNMHSVTAIEETLKITNLGQLKINDIVNLERCMPMNGRLDGHIVQGHVDGVASCVLVEDKEGSREFTFQIADKFAPLVIEKGSVCLNGISLTAFNVLRNSFKVAIIPYTLNHTNIQFVKPGDRVNIEFDVLGKYILRMQELKA